MNLGLTRKEAAKFFDIHHETLTKYEYDSTNVPRSFFTKLENVYGIPVENIYFGNEENYIAAMNEKLIKEVNTMT